MTTANKVRNVMSLMFDWAIQQGHLSAAGSIQNTRYGAVVVANPIRATRRADEPDTVYFELDAVQVKYILHLIREVWPGRHRKRYPVGRRPNYKLLADYILITLGTSERTAEPIAIRFQDVRFEAVEQPDGSLTMEALVWVGGTMVRTKSRGLFRQDSPKAERQKRWVRVPKFAAKVLSELVASHVPDPKRNPDHVLFTTERGRPRDPSAVGELLSMMTPEQVADAMGVSRPTISRKIKAGEIRAVKVGNRNRIPYEEFERYWRKTMGDLVELTRDELRDDLFGDQ